VVRRSQNLPLQPSTTVVACRDKLIDAKVDDEVVALSIEHGTCYGMNRVGSRIWKLLAEPIRIRDLCLTLRAEYRVDAEVCERQVLDILTELRTEGLIATIEEK
jgi:coenzyme PQQ synthesis protein D (PqqD)